MLFPPLVSKYTIKTLTEINYWAPNSNYLNSEVQKLEINNNYSGTNYSKIVTIEVQ